MGLLHYNWSVGNYTLQINEMIVHIFNRNVVENRISTNFVQTHVTFYQMTDKIYYFKIA